jgi:Cu+-exporting ATPase
MEPCNPSPPPKPCCCGGHAVRSDTPSLAKPGQFTCPMHPEVISDTPGDCPKCGMPLESNQVSAENDAHLEQEIRELSKTFWLSLALTLPVFVIAMSPMIPALSLAQAFSHNSLQWIEFALTSPVVLWLGAPFFTKGWRSLRGRNFNMFTLIAIGIGAAYTYSTVAVCFPHFFPESFRHHGQVALYFEAAAVITTLVWLGQLLEAKARGRTGEAIKSLLQLAPQTATRLYPDGREEMVPAAQLVVGDLLRVRPGEKVPADGTILDGSSHLDESMITGESLPAKRGPGEAVVGATLNQSGSFTMKVTKTGTDTLLARMVELVAHAQRSRAPIQKTADQVAGYFVPAVLAAAALTFLTWAIWGPAPAMALALINAVSVLIIACPCALGLATPVSIMVGIGRAAQEGILVKNAEAIESLEKIDTLVVDKTGTLTAGKPEVTDFILAEPAREAEVLAAAASLEMHSEHPLAKSIRTFCKIPSAQTLRVEEFHATSGSGVSGIIHGKTWLAGNAEFLAKLGISIPETLATAAQSERASAKSLVWIACGPHAVALFAIADPIKQRSHAAVAALHRLGIRIIMATGDNKSTAAAIGRSLGIDEIHAGLSPEDKIKLIETLKNQGHRVAMAGDGINDAPALAAAHIGIAMGTGTDIAIESAHLTLIQGDLSGISKAIQLSQEMMRNIRQNLFFAFIYNAAGIPIAAGVLYPLTGSLLSPMIAAAAMSLSSVSVIANALRLRKKP